MLRYSDTKLGTFATIYYFAMYKLPKIFLKTDSYGKSPCKISIFTIICIRHISISFIQLIETFCGQLSLFISALTARVHFSAGYLSYLYLFGNHNL